MVNRYLHTLHGHALTLLTLCRTKYFVSLNLIACKQAVQEINYFIKLIISTFGRNIISRMVCRGMLWMNDLWFTLMLLLFFFCLKIDTTQRFPLVRLQKIFEKNNKIIESFPQMLWNHERNRKKKLNCGASSRFDERSDSLKRQQAIACHFRPYVQFIVHANSYVRCVLHCRRCLLYLNFAKLPFVSFNANQTTIRSSVTTQTFAFILKLQRA